MLKIISRYVVLAATLCAAPSIVAADWAGRAAAKVGVKVDRPRKARLTPPQLAATVDPRKVIRDLPDLEPADMPKPLPIPMPRPPEIEIPAGPPKLPDVKITVPTSVLPNVSSSLPPLVPKATLPGIDLTTSPIKVNGAAIIKLPNSPIGTIDPLQVLNSLPKVSEQDFAALRSVIRGPSWQVKELKFGKPLGTINPLEWDWARADRQKLLSSIGKGDIIIDMDKLDPSEWDLSRIVPKVDRLDPALIALAIDPSGTLTIAYEYQRRKQIKEADKDLEAAKDELELARKETSNYFLRILKETAAAEAGDRKGNVTDDDPLKQFWSAAEEIDLAEQRELNSVDDTFAREQASAIEEVRSSYAAAIADMESELSYDFDKTYQAELHKQRSLKQSELKEHNASAAERSRWDEAFAAAAVEPPMEIVAAKKEFIQDHREKMELLWGESLNAAIAEISAYFAREIITAKAHVQDRCKQAVAETVAETVRALKDEQAAAVQQLDEAERQLASAERSLAKQKDWRARLRLPKFDLLLGPSRIAGLSALSAKRIKSLKHNSPRPTIKQFEHSTPAQAILPKFNLLGAIGEGKSGGDRKAEKPFFRFYGNYGGLGKNGGHPIDPLDAVYMRHDDGYSRNGGFDGKSDARLQEETPAALSSGHVGPEGLVKGPAAFLFFRYVMPSIYRVKPTGSKGPTVAVPLHNGAAAFDFYKAEQLLGFLRNPEQIKVEISRLMNQGEALTRKLKVKSTEFSPKTVMPAQSVHALTPGLRTKPWPLKVHGSPKTDFKVLRLPTIKINGLGNFQQRMAARAFGGAVGTGVAVAATPEVGPFAAAAAGSTVSSVLENHAIAKWTGKGLENWRRPNRW